MEDVIKYMEDIIKSKQNHIRSTNIRIAELEQSISSLTTMMDAEREILAKREAVCELLQGCAAETLVTYYAGSEYTVHDCEWQIKDLSVKMDHHKSQIASCVEQVAELQTAITKLKMKKMDEDIAAQQYANSLINKSYSLINKI